MHADVACSALIAAGASAAGREGSGAHARLRAAGAVAVGARTTVERACAALRPRGSGGTANAVRAREGAGAAAVEEERVGVARLARDEEVVVDAHPVSARDVVHRVEARELVGARVALSKREHVSHDEGGERGRTTTGRTAHVPF